MGDALMFAELPPPVVVVGSSLSTSGSNILSGSPDTRLMPVKLAILCRLENSIELDDWWPCNWSFAIAILI